MSLPGLFEAIGSELAHRVVETGLTRHNRLGFFHACKPTQTAGRDTHKDAHWMFVLLVLARLFDPSFLLCWTNTPSAPAHKRHHPRRTQRLGDCFASKSNAMNSLLGTVRAASYAV
jgi:hypothetical protein